MHGSKVPIGIDDFEKLVRGDYIFADKTMLIDSILSSGFENILFTRPRRFGKTLAVSMLDRFFNIRYRAEEVADDTFKSLLIASSPNYNQYLEKSKNRYPVIRLDMSSVLFQDPDGFKPSIMLALRRNVWNEHMGLTESESIPESRRRMLKRFLDGDNSVEPGMMFIEICDMLETQYGCKAAVFIDEYDKPIEVAFDTPYFDSIAKLYGDFLNAALKSNSSVELTIMTGIQRVVVNGIFSALNDFKHYGMASDGLGDMFGLTLPEVRMLISRQMHSLNPNAEPEGLNQSIDDKMSAVSEWYDGYRIGSAEIFNPWSIMNYIDNLKHDAEPKSYWNYTSQNKILTMVFAGCNSEVLNEVRAMYVGGRIEADCISDASPLWKPDSELGNDDLLTLLLFAGYLTIDRTPDGTFLRIPNKEVKQNFDDLMKRVFCIDAPKVIGLLRHIASKNPDAVKADLEMLMSGARI